MTRRTEREPFIRPDQYEPVKPDQFPRIADRFLKRWHQRYQTKAKLNRMLVRDMVDLRVSTQRAIGVLRRATNGGCPVSLSVELRQRCSYLVEVAQSARSRTLEWCKDQPTHRDILADLRRLHNDYQRNGGLQVNWVKGYLMVQTDPIRLESQEQDRGLHYMHKVDLGAFQIVFNIQTRAMHLPNLKVQPVAAYLSRTTRFWHPHVNTDGSVCMGNFGSTIGNAFNEGRHADVAEIVDNLLHTYNRNSPYTLLNAWPNNVDMPVEMPVGFSVPVQPRPGQPARPEPGEDEFQCHACDEIRHDDEGINCDGCGDRFCMDDCTVECNHPPCERNLCEGCRYTCSECESFFCSRHCENLAIGWLCPDCQRSCPDCNEVVRARNYDNDRECCNSCAESRAEAEAEREREEEEAEDEEDESEGGVNDNRFRPYFGNLMPLSPVEWQAELTQEPSPGERSLADILGGPVMLDHFRAMLDRMAQPMPTTMMGGGGAAGYANTIDWPPLESPPPQPETADVQEETPRDAYWARLAREQAAGTLTADEVEAMALAFEESQTPLPPV